MTLNNSNWIIVPLTRDWRPHADQNLLQPKLKLYSATNTTHYSPFCVCVCVWVGVYVYVCGWVGARQKRYDAADITLGFLSRIACAGERGLIFLTGFWATQERMISHTAPGGASCLYVALYYAAAYGRTVRIPQPRWLPRHCPLSVNIIDRDT